VSGTSFVSQKEKTGRWVPIVAEGVGISQGPLCVVAVVGSSRNCRRRREGKSGSLAGLGWGLGGEAHTRPRLRANIQSQTRSRRGACWPTWPEPGAAQLAFWQITGRSFTRRLYTHGFRLLPEVGSARRGEPLFGPTRAERKALPYTLPADRFIFPGWLPVSSLALLWVARVRERKPR